MYRLKPVNSVSSYKFCIVIGEKNRTEKQSILLFGPVFIRLFEFVPPMPPMPPNAAACAVLLR